MLISEKQLKKKTDERLQEKRKQPEINNKLMWDIYGARFIVKNKEDKEKAHFVLESFFSAFYQRYFILPLENDGIDNPWQFEQAFVYIALLIYNMANIIDLEKRIKKIEDRNKKVEADKAREKDDFKNT